MPRRPQGAIPLLDLDPSRSMPLHRQLSQALREAIIEGRLAPGARLPSTRSLADDLDVSRSTVVSAFEQLVAEGVLVSRSGSGTTVADDLPLVRSPRDLRPHPGTTDGAVGSDDSGPRPFRPGIPAVGEFRRGPFGRVLRRVWREMNDAPLCLSDPMGDPELRIAIAHHLRASRQVRCSPDDVLITAGAQEALSIAIEITTASNDQVWVEHPGYIGARRAIERRGATPVPVRVDDRGLDVEEGARRWPDAVAAYVTPSHQFPTGCVLALPRRLRLLEWAADTDGWIIEDDYDSEFRLDGRPLPSLQGLDERGRVIYVGTFSKSLAPALRIGYLLTPPGLREAALRRHRALTGGGSPWLQRSVAHFLDEGHFGRHIRRTRTLYRQRRDALCTAFDDDSPEAPRIRLPTGAMHAVLDLPPAVDAEIISRRARERRIETIPLEFFAIPPDPSPGPALVLGFAGYEPPEIRSAAAVLRGLIEGYRRDTHHKRAAPKADFTAPP